MLFWGMAEKPKKRPVDLKKLSASIVADATSDHPTGETPPDNGKNPHAVALGRLGGLKGGKGRKDKLSPERRKEIAKKTDEIRWAAHLGDV